MTRACALAHTGFFPGSFTKEGTPSFEAVEILVHSCGNTPRWPMIQVIDRTNAHQHQDVLHAFAALRYQVFVERLGWRIPCREPGREEDQFDDEHAIYVAVLDSVGNLLGGARLLDTSRRSLLAEVFPHLVSGPAPADPKVFEVTRFVVAAPQQSGETRGGACMELLWGLQAYGIWAGLSHLVSVSYLSMEPILRRAGYRFCRMGAVQEIDGSRVAALQHDVNAGVLESARRRVSAPCTLSPPRDQAAHPLARHSVADQVLCPAAA
jgi:N-acyl-L-homoserine lactone synthetase